MHEVLQTFLRLGDAVVITDHGHAIVAVNETFQRITEYGLQDTIGRDAGFMKSTLTRKDIYIEMKRTLREGKHWTGVLINRKRSGRLWHSSLSITPLAVGCELYYVGIFRELERLAEGSYIDEARKMKLQTALLKALALSSEFHDPEIEAHIHRVQELTQRLLAAHEERIATGHSELYMRSIVDASILHDIGKAAIPEHILHKPGLLDKAERRIIEQHPEIGARMLRKYSDELADELLYGHLDVAHNIILHHHEKWDGSGYPFRLAGERIPFEARLVALVDVYDALTSARAYKKGWPPAEAQQYVLRQKGIHFDPDLVDTFIDMSR